MGEATHYLVNHLVTFSLQNGEVRSVEEGLSRLSQLARTDRLWSQEMLVEVSASSVCLRDAQNEDELELYPMSFIYRCDAVLTEKHFPSLLLLVCQDGPQKKPDIHFFNCETVGAELIRDDIVSAVSDHVSKTRKRPEVLRQNWAQRRQQPTPPRAYMVPSPPRTQASTPPPPNPSIKVNGSTIGQTDVAFQRAEREVAILNHCFGDIEAFMGKLQKAAEAHSVLSQRNKKKKSRKKDAEDDLLSQRARPPTHDEFISILQKFKYCFSMLARLKLSIMNPSSEDLVHHLFKPLDLIVKTTSGPALAASVTSPALTRGAVELLQDILSEPERQLWMSLGPNWTLPRSQLQGSFPPYTPIFSDGWKPEPLNPLGQVWEDPIESQYEYEGLKDKQQQPPDWSPGPPRSPANSSIGSDEMDSINALPVEQRLYSCSYDFVARNSSELSVLHGETLEVLESSKRWWKCRNRFNQVGFVPFNILEPLNWQDDQVRSSPVTKKQEKLSPSIHPKTKSFSYAAPSPPALNLEYGASRPRSMPPTSSGESADKVMVMNEELLQRLANGKATGRQLVIPRSAETSVPLDYQSPSAEVKEWLRKKGFGEPTVLCLGVLTGAQLFSLNKEELRSVLPDEGARVYSQLMVQKAALEDARKVTELEAVMEKQKIKVDIKPQSTTF